MNDQSVERETRKKYFWAIIALLAVPISGLSIDIYVPSLPAIHQYFAVDKSLVQLTVTMYVIGFGFMQLFAGSISDSLGRKKPFIFAAIIYIFIALLAPYSQNIYQLLALRFLQGITVACLNVPMRAVLPDLFEGRELFKMMNYLTVAWAIGPIIAPAIGGYLQEYFGWHAPFYFLAIYGVIMLILNIAYMPETAKVFHPFKMRHIANQYQSIILRRDFLIGLICLGLVYAMLILFGIVGPFLIQVVLHYSVIQFSHIALLMGLAWFLGNMTNQFLLDVAIKKKVLICFASMLFVTFIMIWVGIYQATIYSFTVPTFILLYLGGIIFPNYFAANVALFPEAAGTANSLMGAFMTLLAGACSGLGTLLKSTTQIPLSLTYMAMIIICLGVCYFTSKELEIIN